MNTQLFGKDFITTEDWSNSELDAALKLALKRRFAMGELHDHILRAKTLYMLFFEESTRTRNSFETGMTQLGGHAVYLTPSATQIGHGENAKDTGLVRERQGYGSRAWQLRPGHRRPRLPHRYRPEVSIRHRQTRQCAGLLDAGRCRSPLPGHGRPDDHPRELRPEPARPQVRDLVDLCAQVRAPALGAAVADHADDPLGHGRHPGPPQGL